jgi:hypothetical protein
MTRSAGAVLGGVTFLVAHAIEVYEWRAWFAPATGAAAWFLNSGAAAGFTISCLLAAGAIAGAFRSADRRDALVRGASFSAGAVAAMTAVLFATGPGTIWPIVLLIGAAIVTASSMVGTLAGNGARRVFAR